MSKYTHYLRLEGVNLDAFVYDTRNLSTIRGGSLLLLAAAREVETALEGSADTISIGASIGLFGIHRGEPTQHLQTVRDLISSRDYAHATFVVDLVPTGSFRLGTEKAIAANRWQQMQASALSIPPLTTEAAASTPVCQIDGIRPADPKLKVQEKQLTSPATFARWNYGRNQKQNFYKSLTRLAELPKFANEFEDIASGTQERDQKLAIFYADGNRFGSLQTELCDSPAKQALWDHAIRTKRQAFLTAFLRDEVMAKPKDWINTEKKGCARFETLLWGGDELMFVMPAALGWRFATLFFSHFRDWDIGDARLPADSIFAPDKPSFPPTTLTHAASIIFCHHHAPIERIKHLAKDQMAELAKDKSRSADQLVYTVLESYDHLGTSFTNAMARRYGCAISSPSDIVLPCNKDILEALSSCLEKLRDPANDFARSQLRALVVSLIAEGNATAPTIAAASATKSHFFRASPSAIEALTKLTTYLPGNTLWLHLEELWDYSLP